MRFFLRAAAKVFLFFQLGDNCFVMWWQFLLYMSELSICVHTPLPSSISYPTFLPCPVHLCLLEYRAERPTLYKRFPLVTCFTHAVHVHQSQSHNSSHTSICVCTSVSYFYISILALKIGPSKPFF